MEDTNSILKNRQEKQFLINPNIYYAKKVKDNKKKILYVFAAITTTFTIIMFILYCIKKPTDINDNNEDKYKDNNMDHNKKYIIKNSSIVYNNNTTKNYPGLELFKYQNMLPHLTPDLNIDSSIEEIFNAREIYISDVRITPEYIKYIRPINETEEKKYKKR